MLPPSSLISSALPRIGELVLMSTMSGALKKLRGKIHTGEFFRGLHPPEIAKRLLTRTRLVINLLRLQESTDTILQYAASGNKGAGGTEQGELQWLQRTVVVVWCCCGAGRWWSGKQWLLPGTGSLHIDSAIPAPPASLHTKSRYRHRRKPVRLRVADNGSAGGSPRSHGSGV